VRDYQYPVWHWVTGLALLACAETGLIVGFLIGLAFR